MRWWRRGHCPAVQSLWEGGGWWQDCGFLALLTASAAGAHPGTGGAGIRGAHHHVAAAGGAAHSCVDSRGSTRDAEIARDDATAGAAHA